MLRLGACNVGHGNGDRCSAARCLGDMEAGLATVQQGQAPDLAAHTALIDRFVALYETHIALEEGLAFPAGFAGMPSEQRTQMGEEMASRRGATRLPPKD